MLFRSADISGGDVKVVVVLNRDRTGTARITVTPRYGNGKPAVIETSSYTVAVHNRVTGTAVEDRRRNDFYITSQFPEGTHTITGVSKAPAAYGNSASEWVTTDATRMVQASRTSQDGQLTGAVYERLDGGYYWHNNENYDFSVSKSYGCIVSSKTDMDMVAATIKADTNPKSVRTITVVQPREQERENSAPVRAEATRSAPRVSKPLLR